MKNYYKFYEVGKLMEQGQLGQAAKALHELQQSYISLNDEATRLRNQVHYLEELLYVSRNLIFDGDAYWLISEGQKQGPFCPKCYHDNGSLIRFAIAGVDEFEITQEKEHWSCGHCGTVVIPEVHSNTKQQNEELEQESKTVPFMQ